MSTLANRASELQQRIWRIVSGAIANATEAHPDWKFDPRLASSIAKRAAGTLSASAEVLAMPRKTSSDRLDRNIAISGSPPRVGNASPNAASLPSSLDRRWAGSASLSTRAAGLACAAHTLGAMAAEARHAGQLEREAALVDALRVIATIRTHRGALPIRLEVFGACDESTEGAESGVECA